LLENSDNIEDFNCKVTECTESEEKINEPKPKISLRLKNIFRDQSIAILQSVMKDWLNDDAESVKELDNSLNIDELNFIGNLSPCDFVGHVALMKRTVHKVSVISSNHCCTYTFSKDSIGRLVRVEPSVGLQFQDALAHAIWNQSSQLGKVHIIQERKFKLQLWQQQYFKDNGIHFERKTSKMLSKNFSVSPKPLKASIRSIVSGMVFPTLKSQKVYADQPPSPSPFNKKSLSPGPTMSEKLRLSNSPFKSAKLRTKILRQTSLLSTVSSQDSTPLKSPNIGHRKAFNILLRMQIHRADQKIKKRHIRAKSWSVTTNTNNVYSVFNVKSPKIRPLPPEGWTDNQPKDTLFDARAKSISEHPKMADLQIQNAFERSRRHSFPSLENDYMRSDNYSLELLS
jgi:hypothetical protein